MGQIIVAVDRTLGAAPLRDYDPVFETKKLFDVQVIDGKIIDAWSNPIEISIQQHEKGFSLKLISPGPDGIAGTKDDYVQQFDVVPLATTVGSKTNILNGEGN